VVTIVPPGGALTPAVVVTIDPVKAVTVMMGEPLMSYEVDVRVTLAKVAVELMVDEGSVEASVPNKRSVV